MSTVAAGAQPWLLDVPESPSREKRERGAWDQVREMHALSSEVGGLIPPSVAAVLLEVSRQRVHQFMTEGRFTIHQFLGEKYLELRQVHDFRKNPRANGRPRKLQEAA